MNQFHIQGPNRLMGTIEAGGAKNAALPAMAASLRNMSKVRLPLPDTCQTRQNPL